MSLASLLLSFTLAAMPVVGNGDALPAQVAETLQARLQAGGSTAKVAVGALQVQPLPAGAVSAEVGEVAGRWPRARATVPVRLRVDGRLVRTLSMPVTASDVRTVQVFAADYAARTALGDVRLQAAQVDMVCCAGAILQQHPGDDYRLRTDVRAGMPLTEGSVEARPAVQGMQSVQLLVQRGSIRLSADAVALQDGRLGERIPVRPSYAQEAIVAVVTAPGKVQVHE
ncbi:flagellar basal body P-ring formation chaperone FlgA [Stenotrophomonas aracearum]|jgi:flagella basal body P-ring formation protein FlgA|uniref:Flagella basal body P-ring formation protein FlgA n=1 Tax=Stenotrophomonas aracearum TaxID=3003272 RepID=A0ABY9YCL0_9GAMM|nr:flagellar basal body P-ring formation chaperone FlgA [Stenotrophomonas sp. A5588]WNH48597.1 flagellar basal body P-ring formation chaperone FlgA [Stenotrophomonas sp. A5588]